MSRCLRVYAARTNASIYHMNRMWSRASGISDDDLVRFTIEKDLVEVRSGLTTYGTIILGKIRLPAVNDDLGEGFVHVRIHDPPDRVSYTKNHTNTKLMDHSLP